MYMRPHRTNPFVTRLFCITKLTRCVSILMLFIFDLQNENAVANTPFVTPSDAMRCMVPYGSSLSHLPGSSMYVSLLLFVVSFSTRVPGLITVYVGSSPSMNANTP